MRKYRIREREIHIQLHEIEADSKQDALLKFAEEHNDCDCPDCQGLIFDRSLEVGIDDVEEVS